MNAAQLILFGFFDNAPAAVGGFRGPLSAFFGAGTAAVVAAVAPKFEGFRRNLGKLMR